MRLLNKGTGAVVGLALAGGLVLGSGVYTLGEEQVAVVMEYSPGEIGAKVGQLWSVFGHSQVTVSESLGQLPGSRTIRRLTLFPTFRYEFVAGFLSQGGRVRVVEKEGRHWHLPWPLASVSKVNLNYPYPYELTAPLYQVDEDNVVVMRIKGNYSIKDMNTWVEEMFASSPVAITELNFQTLEGRRAYFNLLRGEKRFQTALNQLLSTSVGETSSELETEAVVEGLAKALGVDQSWVMANLNQIVQEQPQALQQARAFARRYLEDIRANDPRRFLGGFPQLLEEISSSAGVRFQLQLSLELVTEPLSQWQG